MVRGTSIWLFAGRTPSSTTRAESSYSGCSGKSNRQSSAAIRPLFVSLAMIVVDSPGARSGSIAGSSIDTTGAGTLVSKTVSSRIW